MLIDKFLFGLQDKTGNVESEKADSEADERKFEPSLGDRELVDLLGQFYKKKLLHFIY